MREQIMNGTFTWRNEGGAECTETLDQRPREYSDDPEWDAHTPEERARALLAFFNDTLRPGEKARIFVRVNEPEPEDPEDEEFPSLDGLPALDFFRPNENFTKWLDSSIHLRYQPIFEIGAGQGLALKHMQDAGLNATGLDLFQRPDTHTLVQVASEEIIHKVVTAAPSRMVMMICRPCHSGFAQTYFKLQLKFHHRTFAYYIGLRRNLELDLPDMSVELVAEDVGEDGECIWQVLCTRADARDLYTLETRAGVYEFDEDTGEYVSTDEQWGIPKGMRVPASTGVRERFLGYRNTYQRPLPLESIEREDCDCGWIDPQGRVYKIPYTQHSAFIYQWLHLDESKDVEGWVKVWPENANDNGLRFYREGEEFEPSDVQIRALRRAFGIKYRREPVGELRMPTRSDGQY